MRGAGRLAGDAHRRRHDAATRSRRVTARRAVVLATGTRPALPPIPGLAEVTPWDNRDATAVKELPRRLVVLGGGAVGLEMAQAFRRLGCEQVTRRRGRPRGCSPGRNRSPATRCSAALEAEGIAVVAGRRRRERASRGRRRPGRGQVDRLAEIIRRRAARRGRPPGHDRASSAWTPSGLSPAGSCRSTTGCAPSASTAAGCTPSATATGCAPLTHMGKYQARIAADVILGKDVRDRASRRRRTAGDVHRSAGLRGRADRGRGAGARARRSAP